MTEFIESDEGASDNVKQYDFRAPNKFSKEQTRTLQMIHESFARRVSSSLSAHLRATVQVAVASVDQGTYGQFVEQIRNWPLIQVISPDPLPGRMLLEIDATACEIIVDRLLGGHGVASATPRETTEIEANVVRSVAQHLLSGLVEAWNNVVTLTPRLEENPLGSQFVQIAMASDAAVQITFDTRFIEHRGLMRILIPFPTIKPIVSLLSPHAWVAGQERDGADGKQEQLRKHLDKARLNLTARFEPSSVSLGDLSNLALGDVIRLDAALSHELIVMVEGRMKFRARPGTVGTHLAVQITRVVDEPVEQ
ncbi:MAG: flagellar motor switch protein FliM [Chloroflexi bacterium]|nr:flagellar motor switch protein FliM [Chloroflexota bacterium]